MLLVPPPRQQAGFTLIELLVTLAVVAVLASFALPSFINLIQSNTTASQTNHFATAINLARSEAIKRNSPVIICKRAGTGCDNAGQWEDGWVVFADNDGDNALDAGEEIQYIDALKAGYTLRPSIGTTHWMAFQASGRVRTNNGALNGVTFRLCAPDADTSESRSIVFNAIGQARLSQGTPSCP